MTPRHASIFAAALAAGAAFATVASAQQAPPQVAPSQAGLPSSANAYGRVSPGADSAETQPKLYTSAARGFTVPVPPGARIESHDDDARISVQSRRGYALNLQTADADPEVPLKSMLGRLDRRYLGEGRPWSAKLSQRRLEVGGLPAIEAVYAGGSTKVRAVIARGADTDFVFLFFAPQTTFDSFAGEFAWILQNFHPAEAERAGSERQPPLATAAPPPALLGGEQPAALAAGRPQPPAAEAERAKAPAMQRFADPGFGYVMQYPSDWVLEKPQAFTALFSGRRGTAAHDAIVSVQNVRADADGAGEADAAAVTRTLQQQLGVAAEGLEISAEKAVVYDRGGVRVEGRQFVADYRHGGRSFRKWALVLPRPDGGIAHVWSYTAPLSAFEAYRSVAEGMLQSWMIADGRG